MALRAKSWISFISFLGFFCINPYIWAYPDKVAGTVTLSVQPLVLRIGPTDRFLYSLDATSGLVSVVDTLFFSEKNTVSFSGSPRDLGVSKDGKTLYIVTNASDAVTFFDLTDPSSPTDVSTFSTDTSGVTFDYLVIAGSSENDLLVLASRTQKAIYIFDRSNDALVTNGSQDRIDLSEEPVSIALLSDGNRVGVILSDGVVEVYFTSSLLKDGGTLDLSGFTSTESFSHLSAGDFGLGSFGFVSNAITAGEVFLVNMNDNNATNFVIDADPTSAGSTEPIFVADSPSGSLMTQVNRSKDDSTASATYLFVANRTSSSISIMDMGEVGGAETIEAIDTLESISDIPSQGLAASSVTEGYVYGANQSDSLVSVITDQPFLTFSTTPASPIGTEDITVSLSSNVTGILTVLRYTGEKSEAISSTAGTTLSFETLEASTEKTLTFSSSELEEGENDIAFFLKSGELLGRTAFTITKDTPPSKPSKFKLEFGNEKIFARWNRNSEADISHYLLHFGTDESAKGGVGALISPMTIEHPSSGSVKFTLEPVTNGTTVFARVIAVDQTGNMSESTETLSEIAEETIGILGLSRELGGCSAKGFNVGFFLFMLFLFLLCRKKRKNIIHFIVLSSAFFLPQILQAETISNKAEDSAWYSSAEFRVGWWVPKDNVLKDFLGKPGNEIYQLRFGLVLGPFNVGLETGVLHEKSKLVGITSGRQSGESLSVTLVPTEISGQYDIHFSEAPIVVPFVRLGYDFIYFNVSEPINSASGLKHALTATGGLRVMLSGLAPGSDADLLGIKDFFLEGLFSYRYQFSGGLDFGGWIFQPGIGFEF